MITDILNMTPLGGLANASNSLDRKNIIEAGGTVGVGIGSLIAMSSLLQTAGEGLHYSIGGERVLATQMGNVFSTLSPEELSKTIRFGEKTMRFGASFNPIKGTPVTDLSDIYARGMRTGGTGLQGFTKLNIGIPLAMTGLGAVHAYATEGMSGLGDFIIQDMFANKYGMEASLEVFSVTDQGKARNYLRTRPRNYVEITGIGGTDIKSVQRAKGGLLNAPLAMRVQTVMGGYIGAAAGMEFGRSVGEITASYFNMNESKQSILGFTGSVFGAAGGAKVGAYMGGSFLRLGLMGLGLGAVSVLQSYVQDSMGGGANLKHRGLNYAGDIAAFQTQVATTMRQRSLQAMHKSTMNARSAFGQEANMIHMNRDLFGQYRR